MFSSKVGFNETMGGPCIGGAIWNITNNDPASPGADTDLQLGKTRKDLERLGKTWKLRWNEDQTKPGGKICLEHLRALEIAPQQP